MTPFRTFAGPARIRYLIAGNDRDTDWTVYSEVERDFADGTGFQTFRTREEAEAARAKLEALAASPPDHPA